MTMSTALRILSNPSSGNNQTIIVLAVVLCVSSIMLMLDLRDTVSQRATSVGFSIAPETQADDFALARSQSYGFFTDITDIQWNLMRQRLQTQNNHNDLQHGVRSKLLFMDTPNAWYQSNWGPNFSCKHERRVGGLGYGAKWVCDPHRIPTFIKEREKTNLITSFRREDRERCLMYSIGNAGSLQFEYGLRGMLGPEACEIHVFDNTPHFNTYQNLPGLDHNVHFHPWSLEGSTKTTTERQFMTLQETVEMLGHRHRVIDIFKITCEKNCEWDMFMDWFDSDVTMIQILAQLHGSPPNANALFETMQRHNYVIFHKEAETYFSDGNNHDYSFIKLKPEFFY